MRFLLFGVGILACILAVAAGIIAMAPYIAVIVVLGILLWLCGIHEFSCDGENHRDDPPEKQ